MTVDEGKAHDRRDRRFRQPASVKNGIGFPHAYLAVRMFRTRRSLRAVSPCSSRRVVYAIPSLA